MKKLALFIATALVSLAASAYTLNNPVGADGRYIVKYDVANHAFAASNDMEVDETFTFAVDVTGTWLADWLKGTPTAEGASRGVAINKWTSLGDVNGETNRLKQIEGNIYGMDVNYAQIATADFSSALMTDSVLYVYGQIFGFEFTEDNPGAGWWMWDVNEVATTQADGADCLFTFAPYTGTHKSADFYASDFESNIFGYDVAGYAAPGDVKTLVVVKDATGWDKTYMYIWGIVNNLTGEWPGAEAYRTDVLADGTYRYFDVPMVYGTHHLIFNNGNGTQLPDYDILGGQIYTLAIDANGASDADFTALENVENENGVQKVIENGNLYIIKNGVRYNALGAIVAE